MLYARQFWLCILANISKLRCIAAVRQYLGNSNDVIVPEGVVKIGDSCFADMGIRSVYFPNSLKTIGFRAFINCNMLTEISIPDSVTTIEAKAFMNCSGLKRVTLSKNIKVVPWKSFWDCSSLEYIVIPNGVKTIADEAFCCCEKMRYCVFPNSLTDVGSMAFLKTGSYRGSEGVYIVYSGFWSSINFGDYCFQNNRPIFVKSLDNIPK